MYLTPQGTPLSQLQFGSGNPLSLSQNQLPSGFSPLTLSDVNDLRELVNEEALIVNERTPSQGLVEGALFSLPPPPLLPVTIPSNADFQKLLNDAYSKGVTAGLSQGKEMFANARVSYVQTLHASLPQYETDKKYYEMCIKNMTMNMEKGYADQEYVDKILPLYQHRLTQIEKKIQWICDEKNVCQ